MAPKTLSLYNIVEFNNLKLPTLSSVNKLESGVAMLNNIVDNYINNVGNKLKFMQLSNPV